jgi:hypothetical protein
MIEKQNPALALLESAMGIPLDEHRITALVEITLPLQNLLQSLNDLDLEGIEPPLLPLWKDESA